MYFVAVSCPLTISKISFLEGSLEYLKFPLLKFKNRHISKIGYSVFNHIEFLTFYAHAAFNWVVSVTKKKSENCWVLYILVKD